MLYSGLVSVSFRSLTVEEIIRQAKEKGLAAIEWGGDIHVPKGDLNRAKEVRALMQAAGLLVASYGSYYRVGVEGEASEAFLPVLDIAEALGAPLIRVWAYNKECPDATEEEYRAVAAELSLIAAMAEKRGIRIGMECHCGTLTDRYDGTLKLIEYAAHPNLYAYFQPNQKYDEAYNWAAAEALLPYIAHVHVFEWDKNGRYPLRDGLAIWQKYAALFEKAGRPVGFLLEFMPDDRVESLGREAEALHDIVRPYGAETK